MMKRGLAALLCALLIGTVGAPANTKAAAVQDTSGTLSEDAGLNASAVTVDGLNYTSAEGAELTARDGLEWTNAEGSVTWNFDITGGNYNLQIEYKPLGSLSDAAEIALRIDGEFPFEGAKSVFLPRLWENEGEKRLDDDGNEFAPKVKQVDGWYTAVASDPSGFHNEPLAFTLSEGGHTLSIDAVSGGFAVKSIRFVPVTKTPGYSDYLKGVSGAADYSGTPVTVQGEDALIRSKKSIVPLSDNSSTSVQPQDAFVSRINYIGSKNWSRPGDFITWEIKAPEDGYYTLNFSYRQSYTINETFYRVLKIDGETPFEEAKTVKFPYSGSWKSTVFADEKETPYKIYLKKGTHTLTLSVTMGPLSEVCAELDGLVYELAAFYRSMVMITGETPDVNRDYSLFSQIADYDERLGSYIEQLDKLLDMLYKITGSRSGTAPTNLRNMKDVLERMRDNKYYAHQYKDRYYTNYAALSAWLYERSTMALDIDAIFLTSPKKADSGRDISLVRQMKFSAERFLSSFASQYRHNTKEETDRSITLWINWGRDQAKVLKNLVSSEFTAESGISVNVRVTNATLLQGILSGNGPDCSIQVARSEPVNLAMRGGLYDLSQFNDYDETVKRFMPGADTPYKYNTGHYGLPDTQTFYMLFYRTDIFEQLGLKAPDTWDEYLNTSNLLLRKNMQVGLPYTQITDMAQVNSGVGALNIFPTMLLQNNISLYNDALTASTLSSSETTEVFVQWTNYYNKYGFPRTYDFYNRFRVGLMPMAVVPYSMYATLTAAAPEISRLWKMAPVPGVRQEDGSINRSATGGGTASIILKASKNPELSWEFIKWWTSTDTQYSYASGVENVLGTAARHPTANVEALGMLSWDKDNLATLMEQWGNVKEIPEIPGGYYLSRVIDQAFWNTVNGEDPYEMAEKWGRVADNEIERKGKQYGG